ncbi:hypothetical protein [Saccharopolyspora dendranthemae]|uniref:Uncharacterized protein n=1 Tax=Saccharopolyspora dendranthemae TaxID=1181886 RepID=A0A561V8B3_9PSEU|nr:hypothetical protein [Saccharopolyspora dendranthemae]TWG07840.1 hypothetical protein FHU35_11459 [Saccharopolyspora dendranthemae]
MAAEDERPENAELVESGVEGEPVPEARRRDEHPDVYLDVPVVKVDEISLEVENLRARVSLQAEVLDLLKLNVGVDAELGRVALQIKGVEAQARLDVRLDNVANVLDRVLTTIDRNPQILENLTRSLGRAVEDVGEGAGSAVKEVGEGAGQAVEEVGEGAGSAVEEVGSGAGSAVQSVGEGAGSAVEDVGAGAGGAVENVGEGAGSAVKEVGSGAGGAVENVGEGAGSAVEDVGEAAEDVGEGAGRAVEDVGDAAEQVGRGARDVVGDDSGGEESPKRRAAPREPVRRARRSGRDAPSRRERRR